MSHRRTHRKSKLGCQECKRRHIKCDEAKPACLNCSTTERSCVYRLPPPRRSYSSSPPLEHPSVPDVNISQTLDLPTPALSHFSAPSIFPLSITSPSLTDTSPAQHGALHPALNMRHMELLTNFLLETAPSVVESTFAHGGSVHTMMTTALSTPYLMHLILAISALHLSHIHPERAAFHLEEATTLQIQALSLFDETFSTPGVENCEAMLLFASLLSFHALGEAVTTSRYNADGFLDRFVSYLNLHRGVRTITEQCWGLLLQSSLSPVLKSAIQHLDSAKAKPHEQASMVADLLSRLLEKSDMSTESAAACRDSVDRLKLIYQAESFQDNNSSPNARPAGKFVWVWPVLLSGGFTELLFKRQPEALIILCYYAVFLHQHRGKWHVGSAGRMLIESTTKSLGSYWLSWLEWPNEMISDTSGL